MSRKKRKIEQSRGGLDILEEAVHTLRRSPATLIPYYIGSLPFVLALLFFWTDMTRSPFAYRHCAQTSLGLALLFIWMKTWQTVFAQNVMMLVRGGFSRRWSLHRIINVILIQMILQPWGLLILPLTLIVTVLFPWAYAFYQNVTVFGHGDEFEIKVIVRRAWKQARVWPKQNLILIWLLSPWLLIAAAIFILLLIPFLSTLSPETPLVVFLYIMVALCIPLSPVGLIVALNLGSAILLLPQLVKTLFGVETIFTLSQLHALNTTFFAVVCAFTYLCLDPVVKVAYALRCFYGESLQTGEDLKVGLRNFLRPAKIAVSGMLILGSVLLVSSAGVAQTSESSSVSSSESPASEATARELDEALERVINEVEYTWRVSRENISKSDQEQELPPFLQSIADIFDEIGETLRNWGKSIRKLWNRFSDWVEDLFPTSSPKSSQYRSNSNWMPRVQVLIFVLLAVITCILALLLWRVWRQRRQRDLEVISEEVASTPDITSQDVDATELPEDGWFAMANKLLTQGQLRLALRALYLATLACLAEQNLITITRFKSDREYERELKRRAHSVPALLSAFGQNMDVFERVWYGMHEVTQLAVEDFSSNYRAIKTYAQR